MRKRFVCLVAPVALVLSVFQAGSAMTTCLDWVYQPYSRTTYTSLDQWYALEVGSTFTLAVGIQSDPYYRVPYLLALGHPGEFPESSPEFLPVLDQIQIPSASENICLNGTTAYMSTGVDELAIVDVSDPSAMVIDHNLTLTNGCRDMLLDESRELLVTAEWDAVRIYSTSDPRNPVLLASQIAGQSMALARRGDMIFVACASLGLRVIDLSDPTDPVQIAHLPVGGTVRDVALTDDQALLVGPTVGLISVDISNPWAPVYLSTVPCEGDAEQVSTKNGYAYIRSMNIRHPEAGFYEEKLLLYRLLATAPPLFEGSYFAHPDPGVIAVAGDNVIIAGRDILTASVQCPQVSAVGDLPGLLTTLGHPWPNPFNPTVEFTFSLPPAHAGRVSVYDLGGRLVRELWTGYGTGEGQKIRWDGATQDGTGAASGSYLFVLQDDRNGSRTTRLGSLVR